MKEYIQELISRNGLRLSLLLIMILVFLNAILVIYYRNVILNNSEISQNIQRVKDRLNEMDTNIRLADIGVRAYIIKQNEQLLDPYKGGRDRYRENLDILESELILIDYDLIKMAPARKAIEEYMQTCKLMVDLCDQGQVDEATDIFLEDRGLTAWQRYYPFVEDCTVYLSDLNEESQKSYRKSINLILVVQILLILLSLPILILAYRKIVKDNRFKSNVFNRIKRSNKNYLFDDGVDLEIKDGDAIIEGLVTNLKKAAVFINSIAKGKYDIGWEGMDQEMDKLNKENIAGELIMMRDQMQKAKRTDEIRIWTNEGLSKFADLIRKHQNDIHELSSNLITSIVEYLSAQQGGLFFVSEDEHKESYLELMGCYAYQRKKFQEKRIEIGQGMVGQCFLEGETTYLNNLPEEFVNITSGLGETKPKTLLIVPLKVNEDVVGVIELASLREFEKHQIEFLERLAETIASSIASVKTNESTRILLEQSQQQAEEMHAQEEEMRQNMEELQATQEQMNRKNDEVENLLRQASENEESMKLQMEALQELQDEAAKASEQASREAEDYKEMMMEILNEVPQKIFLKDADGKMYLANQKVADAHGLPLSELIGKSDYDFVDKETADDWRKQELEIMKKGEERYVFEDSIGGKKTILESIKKVFKILPLGQEGLLGIQNDITEKAELENKLKALEK